MSRIVHENRVLSTKVENGARILRIVQNVENWAETQELLTSNGKKTRISRNEQKGREFSIKFKNCAWI